MLVSTLALSSNWITIQRRIDTSVDFNRNWNEYANGFGKPRGNYWLGLNKISDLTIDGESSLFVYLEAYDGDTAFAYYETFRVADSDSNYRLQLDGYSGLHLLMFYKKNIISMHTHYTHNTFIPATWSMNLFLQNIYFL